MTMTRSIYLGSIVFLSMVLIGCTKFRFTGSEESALNKFQIKVSERGGRGQGQGGENQGEEESHQDGCVKVETLEVGQTIDLGDAQVTIINLIYKDDSEEDGEVIGFEVETDSGALTFLVKAGGDGYEGEGTSWVNPNGTGGPDASAISHVTFCDGVDPVDILDPSLPDGDGGDDPDENPQDEGGDEGDDDDDDTPLGDDPDDLIG